MKPTVLRKERGLLLGVGPLLGRKIGMRPAVHPGILGPGLRREGRPGKRAALKEDDPLDVLIDELERVKASIRAKVEHPFRVIKRQFGHVKVRYRGLKKNTAQLFTLFALSNLWMVRSKLLSGQA